MGTIIIDENVILNSNIGNSFIGNSNVSGNQVSIDCEDEVEIIVDGKTLTKVKAKKVVFKGNAKKVNGAQFNIEGNVSGNVDGTNVTIIGDVDGDIDGTNITVEGTVSGNIDGANVIVKN